MFLIKSPQDSIHPATIVFITDSHCISCEVLLETTGARCFLLHHSPAPPWWFSFSWWCWAKGSQTTTAAGGDPLWVIYHLAFKHPAAQSAWGHRSKTPNVSPVNGKRMFQANYQRKPWAVRGWLDTSLYRAAAVSTKYNRRPIKGSVQTLRCFLTQLLVCCHAGSCDSHSVHLKTSSLQ